MQLQEIMRTDFDVVSANDFAEDALNQMRRQGCGCLFVIDREGIIGIVLRDEMEKLSPARLKYAAVRDFITSQAYQVPANLSLREASSILNDHPGACLLVTGKEQPVGVVTQQDLLRAVELSGSRGPIGRVGKGTRELHRELRPARY